METLKDFFGREVEITSQEKRKISQALKKCWEIENDNYPNGEGDEDLHIYGSQREVVEEIEKELEEKYNTTFQLW